MANMLYGVAGEGSGHASRSRENLKNYPKENNSKIFQKIDELIKKFAV